MGTFQDAPAAEHDMYNTPRARREHSVGQLTLPGIEHKRAGTMSRLRRARDRVRVTCSRLGQDR